MTESKPDLTTTSGKLEDLRLRLAETEAPVGTEAVDAVHEAGRSTARERVLALLDHDSFVETDALARHRSSARDRPVTDGVVAGYGLIDGRRVCVYSQDETVFDGQLGEVYAEKILKVYDLATKTGVPIVGILAGAGPRAGEGVVTLSRFAEIFHAASEASGLIPQIALVAGDVTDLHSVAPQFADLIVGDIPGAHLPGGLAQVRELFAYLPFNNRAEAPRTPSAPVDADDTLDTLIPDSPSEPYDVREVVAKLVDDAVFLEVQQNVAANVVTGFARVEGRAVGVVANQPAELDADAATKAAGFIRMCDAFNLQIVQLVDAPGYSGSPRAAAQLVYANSEAVVGKVTVILRKAVGAAYVLMGAKGTGADLVYAWPTAEIAVTGDSGDPYSAAEQGLVDAVIEPARTRGQLVDALRLLDRKVVAARPKKHGNIPL